jgi:hypothetical protein
MQQAGLDAETSHYVNTICHQQDRSLLHVLR